MTSPTETSQTPAAATARSWMCVCGHRLLDDHALTRDSTAPGGVYHWRHCKVDGCDCTAARNETGTIGRR